MKIHSVYDAGEDFCDRYTVFFKGRGTLNFGGNGKVERVYLAMSEHPSHPQGFGQHGTGIPGLHIGKPIKFEDLPEDCQRAVKQDLNNQEV